MNNANETRAEFNHLIAVAKDTGCAIVIIAHMNKAKDTSPLYRTNGSIDIAGAARSILAVTRTANKQNPAERYLVQVKSNLAPMGSAILFEVADKGVNFLDELELSAEDAFSASAPRMGRPNAREEAATDFIRSLLAGGRRLASDREAKLEAADFKKSTYLFLLRRQKADGPQFSPASQHIPSHLPVFSNISFFNYFFDCFFLSHTAPPRKMA